MSFFGKSWHLFQLAVSREDVSDVWQVDKLKLTLASLQEQGAHEKTKMEDTNPWRSEVVLFALTRRAACAAFRHRHAPMAA